MNYFDTKDPHSTIKHNLYQNTLKASLSIANQFKKPNQSFVFVDLYAGKGKFEDGSDGSPLLALRTYKSIIDETDMMPVRFIFSEKDKDSFSSLGDALEECQQECKLPTGTQVLLGNNEWNELDSQIKSTLEKSTWGFIFADPFSNEIDLEKFAMLRSKSYLKDILIFINLNAILRQASYEVTRKKIADFIKVPEEKLLGLKKNKKKQVELFNMIKDAFKLDDKHFNLFAALPSSRNNKGNSNLVNGDFFCLSCSTNSIGVANAFLESYANEKEINLVLSTGLFGSQEIENRIIELLEDGLEKDLHEVFAHTMEEFLSWTGKTSSEVPTSNNIHQVLNDMINRSIVTIKCPDHFLGKTRANGKRFLLKDAIRKNENLKQVFIMQC